MNVQKPELNSTALSKLARRMNVLTIARTPCIFPLHVLANLGKGTSFQSSKLMHSVGRHCRTHTLYPYERPLHRSLGRKID
jgi:hypothetical protein